MLINTEGCTVNVTHTFQAHKRGEIELLAITTVSGNCSSENAVRNTFRTMETAGCDGIPVFKGAATSLVVPYTTDYAFHGKDGFNDLEFDREPEIVRQSESAYEAMHRLIRDNPGEVTLVCLAPLTNLALALRTKPDVMEQLKAVYFMGGNVNGIGNVTIAAEFNFFYDPEAAHICLNALKCPINLITWEMCFEWVKPSMKWRKEVLGKLKTPEADLMNRLEQPWFDDYDVVKPEHWIMCDQFAVIAALDPSSVTKSADYKAMVELSGMYSRGNTLLERRLFVTDKKGHKNNVTVIENMDMEKIKKHLLSAFGVSF